MPIKPENRPFYGRQWRAYRAALIRAHGTRCPKCGRDQPRYMNLIHLLRDPREPVVALRCPTCHGRFDAGHNRAIARRSAARRAGQMWLLPEIEYAATPTRDVPRAVLEAGQMELF